MPVKLKLLSGFILGFLIFKLILSSISPLHIPFNVIEGSNSVLGLFLLIYNPGIFPLIFIFGLLIEELIPEIFPFILVLKSGVFPFIFILGFLMDASIPGIFPLIFNSGFFPLNLGILILGLFISILTEGLIEGLIIPLIFSVDKLVSNFNL